MSSFAIYRLPHAHTCTLVEQDEEEPERLSSCTELNGKHGFVVAPFCITSETPLLLIHPDHVSQRPVQQPEPFVAEIVETDLHRCDYSNDFTCYHDQLSAGTFRKIVLARNATLRTRSGLDPMQFFWYACQHYPRLFIAFVALPDGSHWLTATPEILLEGTCSHWRTIALAGTMQLEDDELTFDTPPSEGHAADNLRWSTKNIQEQRYVATYIAHTLEQQGIDFHEEGPRTVRAANLVHLRSDFTFTLPSSAPIGNLLQALHPTPAVCGLPKDATFQFICAHEHTKREYYSGFMGPLNISAETTSADTHLYVALRCMKMWQNEYRLFAGGGLLSDSTEESEWQETEAKMQTMRSLFTP